MVEVDDEFSAMQVVFAALEPLEKDVRERVLTYVMSRLGVVPSVPDRGGSLLGSESAGVGHDDSNLEFEELGELFDAFDPKTDVEKALVAAYWSAQNLGEGTFDSQSLNGMLKNLGHGVANITRALGGLTDQKPALVIQTRKGGSTKQARKTYKITRGGIKAVKDRLGGGEVE